MSVDSFLRRGSDFTNPEYSPLRLGKSLDELDRAYDYDFERLAEVERKLANVDRRAVFAELFRRICAGCETDLDRHLAVLGFCNQSSFHNLIQPMWPDGKPVYDPLICLELGEHRCGQTARIVVALFSAGGYRARLVQLGRHTSSEVFYDDDWHYIDAGLFGDRLTAHDPDGSIPSYAELSRRPFAIDAIPSNLEPTYRNRPLGSSVYPSWYYFSKQSYTTPARHYTKTASLEEERAGRAFGWTHYETRLDEGRILGSFDRRYHPGAPRDLRRDGDRVVWREAADIDGDLIGYRVYIGSESRGWCYGPDWKPEMYDALFKTPPRDVGFIDTRETSAALPDARPIFITVMAYDEHGELVGRTLYPMSRELALEGLTDRR
jgi:hypothetical protein